MGDIIHNIDTRVVAVCDTIQCIFDTSVVSKKYWGVHTSQQSSTVLTIPEKKDCD